MEVLDVSPQETQVLHQGETIGRAQPGTVLDLQVPPVPDYLQAVEASRRYAGFNRHAFPGCFVCGPERGRGDGLRIFAGPVEAGDASLVAAPWVPDASLDAGDGKVRPEFMWAALDCPGFAVATPEMDPLLLGEFTAHADRRVRIEIPCILVGWRISHSRRKHVVGTALYDGDGELCARARAVWIEPRPA
jgi:hypothetical protein